MKQTPTKVLKNYSTIFLKKTVTVTIDRPKNSSHPRHKNIIYEQNYGYIDGVLAPDGEFLDAYILFFEKQLKIGEKFTGKCIAVVKRKDDNDDKLVVVPNDFKRTNITEKEILGKVNFQEKFFSSYVVFDSINKGKICK